LAALPHQAKGQPSNQVLRAVLSLPPPTAELADGEEPMEESMEIGGWQRLTSGNVPRERG
jgi:hypothetical protein